MLTQGISEMDAEDQSEILRRVAAFDDFTEDNDPYGEHDFGAFDYKDERIFWKIDYYNRDLSGGSEDPASTEKTVRRPHHHARLRVLKRERCNQTNQPC